MTNTASNPDLYSEFPLPTKSAGETPNVAAQSTVADPYARFLLPAPTVDELGLPASAKRLFDDRKTQFVSGFVPNLAGLILTAGINREVNSAALVNEFILSRDGDKLPVGILSYKESPRFEYIGGGESEIMNLFQNPFEHESPSDFIWQTVRSRPDCIILDEIRNESEAAFAIDLALSGFLVFSSISATTSARAIQKIVNLFREDRRFRFQRELAKALIGVFNQVRPSNSASDFRDAPVFEVLKVDEPTRMHIISSDFLLIDDDIDNGSADEMLSIKESFESRVEHLKNDKEIPKDRLDYLCSYVHSLPDSERLLKLHENG